MSNDNTSTLVIRLDKQLHRQIKSVCALKGMSIKEYILGLVTENIQEQDKKKENSN